MTNAALLESGLEKQRNWSIRQLSSGQKQRLLIACFLAIGQPVMLLVEPLTYLDAQGVELLIQLLKSRTQAGQAVMIVEHQIDIVQQICDRCYFFQAGELVESAHPALLEQPKFEQPIFPSSSPLLMMQGLPDSD